MALPVPEPAPGDSEESGHAYEGLRSRFDTPLRLIARQCVRAWFSRARLDRVLADGIVSLEDCELLYAINADGRQVSSNVCAGSIDEAAYGQDLSRRPYAVSLSVLNNAAFRGAFLCDPYMSRVTRRPCVTLMYGVTSGSSLLGYLAADFHPRHGPEQPRNHACR